MSQFHLNFPLVCMSSTASIARNQLVIDSIHCQEPIRLAAEALSFSMLQALSGKPARSWCKGWNLVLGFLLWCGFEAVGKGPGRNPLRGTETFIGYEPKS